MTKAKMTAKQKQEQAAKQKKKELIIISVLGAVLIAAVILIVVLVGNGEQITHTHDENCDHGTEPVTTTAHEHDENCSHEENTSATIPVTRDNGGDGATLETAEATHYVTIEIENYGTLKGELYGNTAPISVNNFVELAQNGFYDGLTFHRIIEGFMMQGGAPNANSPAVESIQGEFSANGIENNLLHEPGVLSMARTDVMDSATSQFFIMHEKYPSLDGKYAAFGRITEGLEIVDRICTEAEPVDFNGSIAQQNQPVIKSITVTEA